MSLVLFGAGRSRSFRALWAIEELGLELEYREVDFRERGPDFMATNPAGKVPALIDQGRCLTESGAILAWLGDAYGDGSQVPRAGSWSRAEYDRWSYFAQSELEQGLWSMGKHKFALPRDWRVPGMLETGPREFHKASRALAEGLGDKEWILGERFSFADVMLVHTLEWAQRFQVPAQQEELQAYRLRGVARPAYQRALQRVTGSAAPT